MARHARKLSSTGIYHIMLRGINRQSIFENEDDCKYFLNVIAKVKDVFKYKLIGYCLMDNHVHLLIGVGDEMPSNIIKSIGVRYASWFNRKYSRSGHLFQDRYKSEVVIDDSGLLSVLRYIHRNPLMAGQCKNIRNYNWSSYQDYIAGNKALVDVTDVLEIFSVDSKIAKKLFAEYMQETSEDTFMEIEDPQENTDKAFKERMWKLCGIKTVSEFQALIPEARDINIRKLREAGMSIRRISRITGIPFGIVRRK
jgi:REP element-mobilizing transposase RayT